MNKPTVPHHLFLEAVETIYWLDRIDQVLHQPPVQNCKQLQNSNTREAEGNQVREPKE